jgi:hypothetical protein
MKESTYQWKIPCRNEVITGIQLYKSTVIAHLDELQLFSSLAYTKLRNVTIYNLHNTYNQLKALHRGFQQMKIKKKEKKTVFLVFQF